MGKRRIIFDYGHGGKDSGATLGTRLEKNDVLTLGKDVRKVVQRHGVIVDETRKGDEFISLSERSSIANEKDYEFFISFHRNAFDCVAGGVEVFTYVLRKPRAVSLATELVKGMSRVGFRNRGVKSADFSVLRRTKADAVLMEVGFIDNVADNKIYDDNYYKLVLEISKAILKVMSVKYVPEKKSTNKTDDVFYRVVTGSFNERDYAEKRMEDLKDKGFASFIDVYRRD